MIFDFDLDFLRDAANLVDERLELFDSKADASPDPDSFGVYDEIEYITGFGFVACQTYLTATIGRSGIEKGNALDLGPRHSTGRPLAALINACANHWKHRPEWAEADLSAQAKRTLEAIASLGVDTSGSYPLANALYELLAPQPTRFATALPFLTQWRDAVRSEATV